MNEILVNLDGYVGTRWTEMLPQVPRPAGMEAVWIEPIELWSTDDELKVASTLFFEAPLSLTLPGLDVVAVILAPGGSVVVTLEARLFPVADLRIEVPIGLRFDSTLLRTVRRIPNPEPGQPDGFELDPSTSHVEVTLGQVTLTADLDGNLELQLGQAVQLPPCMIGESGVVIEAESPALYLSRKGDRPPPLPDGFRGCSMTSATVHLPRSLAVALPQALSLSNARLGTGGFTGAVAGEWMPTLRSDGKGYEGPGAGTLFGIPFALRKLGLEFQQNAITGSDISGELILPFFDHSVGVDLCLAMNGDFTAALSATQPPGVTRNADGLIEFQKPGLLKVSVDSLGFEKHGGDFLVKLSGRIKLLYGSIDWPEVEVRELSIDQDGRVRIDGGWLDLPSSKVLDFNGFTMELSRIGFGNAGDRKWIGFSGGIRLVDELAFGASVEGLKVLWDAAGNVDLQMSSIRVNLAIPDVLAFDGFVSYFQEGDTKGFRGDIALQLDPLDTSFDASLIVGRNQASPAFNFFYIYVDADLPAGIPLGQSNLAIYGFAALLGHNVTPTRTPEQEWFQWYLLPPIGTTSTQKWADLRGTQALGAGLTLGTAADDGFAFAAKAILVILMPGPLLLIDGKANMLKKRSLLAGDSQGDYRALAVLDRRAGTFLVNIQPRYKYDPAKGAMLDVIGVAEGFFDFNRPEAWHLYLGEDEPPEKRIRAKIFKGLLKADSYLMLDDPGMRFGASVGFDEDYKYGPLRVALKARIDGEAQVSWRPMQADGTITLEGLAALRAFGCKSSASVNARLEVQTPDPYHVYGSFRVKLKTPWPLRDPSARVRLEWGNPEGQPAPVDTVARVAAEHLKVSDAWDLVSGTKDELPADLPVVPLDAKLLINFNRPTADRARVACNAAPAPPREKVGRVEVLHELTGLRLSRAVESHAGWTVVEERTEGEGDLYGMWLPLPGNGKSAGKLQLWSGSPFTYGRKSGRSYCDGFLEQHPAYPCFPEEPAEPICVDFDAVGARLFAALFVVGDFIFEFLFPAKEMQPKLVPFESGLTGTHRALLLSDPQSASVENRVPLRITLPEPAADVRLFVNADRPISLRAFREAQEVGSAVSTTTGNVEIVVEAHAIEYVELAMTGPEPRGKMHLLRVCCTPQSDRDRAEEVQLARSHLAKEMAPATARWCGEGHLLQPGSLYELEITTQRRIWHNGEEETTSATPEYVYFRTTAGPPGFFDTKSPLRDLTPYVSVSASTPQNGAEPVYRGYDVRLVFNENYVERLYDGNGHPLAVVLLERNGQPARDELGMPVSISTAWLPDPYTVQDRSDELWRWALNREQVALGGCAPGDLAACAIPNSTLEARLADRPLAPRTLIEARLHAAGRDEPIYRSNFTTSRFVTFSHQIHSFADVAWDHHRLLGEPPDPLLNAEELGRAGEIVAARRDSGTIDAGVEASMFDEASALFKLGHRPLPERVEIALLRDAGRSYALLLESPEPIERARTTLTLRHAGSAPFTQPSTGPAKIIDAAMSGSEGEWVDLLVQGSMDISGYAIQYAGGQTDPLSFTTYYEFTNEGQMPAGTIIRVHPGTEARLNPAGGTLRLVDARGRQIHRRHVAAAAAFEELGFVALRNADQTRMLIFFPESEQLPVGNIPDGVIRMEWRFLLDIGPAARLLKRGGSTDPENAAIEFSLPALWP